MRSWAAWLSSTWISVYWIRFGRRWRKRGIRGWRRRSASGGGGARREKERRKRKDNAEERRAQRSAERLAKKTNIARKFALTTPDLVLLSLLAERPMHGYQANAELERREIRDWAGISRPQVYYSMEKLAGMGFIRVAKSDEPTAGPERSVFMTTARGCNALADALEREEWAEQRERPPFLTWVA